MTDVEHLRNQLAQAFTRAVSPTVRDHLLKALREVDEEVPRRLEPALTASALDCPSASATTTASRSGYRRRRSTTHPYTPLELDRRPGNQLTRFLAADFVVFQKSVR